MDIKVINLIIGGLFGLIALLIIGAEFRRQRMIIEDLLRKGELVKVVVATRDIPRESTITKDMIRIETVPAKTFQPGDLADPNSVIGKFAENDILHGQHINSAMVRTFASLRYLSEGVPVGMRAITIPVDKISAVEGLIRPGDRVDVVGVFAVPAGPRGETASIVVNLFQGVKVLATGRNLSPYRLVAPTKAEGAATDTITVALKPDDVQMLTYVLEIGKIRLVLRAPLDAQEEPGYTAMTLEGLLSRLGMLQPRMEPERQDTVEVYRRDAKSDEPLAK
jgi:pilus assembly protein CpaB